MFYGNEILTLKKFGGFLMENNTDNKIVNEATKKVVRCNERCECYSRVTGFFRPVDNFNSGKQQEFKERHFYES